MTRADRIDVETVAAYCQLRDGGPALRAKVGFFLDQHQGLWGIDSGELDQFRPQDPGPAFHLDPAPIEWTHYVEEWNLVVPVEVVERQWELVF